MRLIKKKKWILNKIRDPVKFDIFSITLMCVESNGHRFFVDTEAFIDVSDMRHEVQDKDQGVVIISSIRGRIKK